MIFSTTLPNLPRWRCHKVVTAAKIVGYGPMRVGDDAAYKLALDAEGDPHVLVSMEWMRKRAPGLLGDDGISPTGPVSGGYFVIYEDGYTSWSPTESFESGYTQIGIPNGN